MKKFERVKAVVSLDAIAHNFEEMKKNIADGTRIVAVIKADGYGHGAEAISRLIEDYEYIWGFATATAEEAIQLKDAGIEKPVLILGLVFEEYFQELIRKDVRLTVCEYDVAKILSDEAVRQGRQVHIHIALDTGMSRIGFADKPESVEEIKKIAALPNVEIEGMFTHFARADETDKAPAVEQLKRYLTFADLLEKAGVQIPLKHCSNSAGIIRMPEANLNLVRAGITIYGIYPSDEVDRCFLSMYQNPSFIRQSSRIPIRIANRNRCNTKIVFGSKCSAITDRRSCRKILHISHMTLQLHRRLQFHNIPLHFIGRINTIDRNSRTDQVQV